MVSKKQIDEYFCTNIKRLEGLTKSYIVKNKCKIEPLTLINEAYIYCHEKASIIDNVESTVLNWIRKHTIWTNTKVFKNEVFKDSGEIKDIEIENNSELLSNIKCIEEVYLNEEDIIKRSIHRVYFEKNITTCRGMADHFGISLASAKKLIDELKTDCYVKIKSRIY